MQLLTANEKFTRDFNNNFYEIIRTISYFNVRKEKLRCNNFSGLHHQKTKSSAIVMIISISYKWLLFTTTFQFL